MTDVLNTTAEDEVLIKLAGEINTPLFMYTPNTKPWWDTLFRVYHIPSGHQKALYDICHDRAKEHVTKGTPSKTKVEMLKQVLRNSHQNQSLAMALLMRLGYSKKQAAEVLRNLQEQYDTYTPLCESDFSTETVLRKLLGNKLHDVFVGAAKPYDNKEIAKIIIITTRNYVQEHGRNSTIKK